MPLAWAAPEGKSRPVHTAPSGGSGQPRCWVLNDHLKSTRVRLCLLQAGLPGFYDPCVGEEKNLKVLYQFRGVLHQVMAPDGEALRIPKQCE